MPFIEVKQDPTIEHSDIIVQLGRNTDPNEVGEENYDKNLTNLQQTSIYGVQCPLISINDAVIRIDDILNFELDDRGKIPSVSMIIIDRYDLNQYFSTPSVDNELRIEILPPFENAYKKINLNFYITSFKMINPTENIFSVKGAYKLPALTDSQYKSHGQISTYKLFELVAKDTKLGFATNVEDTEDKKFAYNKFNSYLNILDSAVKRAEGKDRVYDWFIDCWNYLTLIDLKDRLQTIVHDDDNQVWVSNQIDEISAGVEIIPYQVVGTLTNLFGANESQLFVTQYRKNTSPGNNTSGTDTVASTYLMDKSDYTDTLIGNMDVKNDLYKKYVYTGEVYGDYDYKTAEILNKTFYQKIGMETLEVDLRQPLLALCRGEKINFECYYDDEYKTNIINALKDTGEVEENTQTVTNTEDLNPNNEPNKFKLDVTVTGQYVVMGNIYKFNDKHWTHTCILARPANQKVDLFNLTGSEATAVQQQEKRFDASELPKIQSSSQVIVQEAKDKAGYDGWINCIQTMANFYQNNIHTYRSDTTGKDFTGPRKSYECHLLSGNKVEDDCSSFVKACLEYFGIKGLGSVHTANMQPGMKFDTVLLANGFERYVYDKSILKKGDIVCGEAETHTEIFWGNGKTMSWGAIHDIDHGGMPSGFYNLPKKGGYKHIWRYIGK